jgi:hypothetical protein
LPLETAPLLEIIFFGGGVVFGVSGRVCTKWICLDVIAENMKMYSYLHVIKNLYPQDDS